MVRRLATVRIASGGVPSNRSLNELLPPLPSEDQEKFITELQAIEASEHAGWLAIQQELDDGQIIT